LPDVQAVLDTLAPREVEVQSHAGAWYMMRIQAYRTLENVIEGAVITFVAITEMKQAQVALKEADDMRHLALTVRDARDAVTVHDMQGRTLVWNAAAERSYGWNEIEALALNIRDRIPASERGPEQEPFGVPRSESVEAPPPCRTRRVAKDGRILEVWVTATPLVNGAGEVYAVATIERVADS